MMTPPDPTCWSDEIRGLKTCKRLLADVNRNGRAYMGCSRCKRVLGEAVGPATPACDPYENGWREIPQEWLR